jgi:hypothetical protein
MSLPEVGKNFAIGIEAQDQPVREVGDKRFVINAPEGSLGVTPYFGTHEIGGTEDQNIQVVVEVDCGMNRDANIYYDIAQQTVTAAGLEKVAAIFAPGPLTDADIFAEKTIPGLPDDPELRSQFLYWTTRGSVVQNWKNGDRAVGPVRVSWYSVKDRFASEICGSEQFPNLAAFVRISHSAHAQVEERDTAVGIGPDQEVLEARGVHMRRVASNPGTHLYFDSWRPREVPPEYAGIVGAWRCGFDSNLPDFVARQGLTPLKHLARFATRNFVLLLGEEDNAATVGVEIHPAAIAQDREGCEPNRYFRGLEWAHYMQRRIAENELDQNGGSFQLITVPSIKHDARSIFTSPEGLEAIFGGLALTT